MQSDRTYICMRVAGHSNYTRPWEEHCSLPLPSALPASLRWSLCFLEAVARAEKHGVDGTPRNDSRGRTDELIPRSTSVEHLINPNLILIP